jgi:UDP-3-O-[3-hydroxymyristoyl] N-acetylglucosamine deacetylase
MPESSFVRLDAHGRPEREIRAHARYVTATELATVLGDDDAGPCVSTIEHIMATLCGLGVDNAVIEIDGPKRRSWTAARRLSSRRSIRPASWRCPRRAASPRC